ncbi:MAG: hypothetical protein KZQ83_01675 [gamma proteobacterium symbiont of Taylorina sp.]|nr:hypothetical protein [gamma proteobacterium symbiont of Taylorina sp.]
MSINYEFNDWKKFQSYLAKKIQSQIKAQSWTSNIWFNIVLWAGIGFILMFLFKKISYFHWPTALFSGGTLIVIFISYLFELKKLRKAFAPSVDGSFLGNHTFIISEKGIDSIGDGYNCTHSWKKINEISRENGLIMLFVDTTNAYIFPEHKLKNPDDFYTYIKECNKASERITGT